MIKEYTQHFNTIKEFNDFAFLQFSLKRIIIIPIHIKEHGFKKGINAVYIKVGYYYEN